MTPKEMVFADRKKTYPYSIATLCSDGVYRSQFGNKTLEEVQVEHPDAEMIDLDEFVEITEKLATTDPTEITEERFWYLLEVLPPCSWQRQSGSESFYMSEFTTGRVTNHVVRIGGRYFNFEAPVMRNHSERMEKVLEWLKTQPEPESAEEPEEEQPLNDADELERRMTREEIIGHLEGTYCVACYDHESTRELAECLAEAANTEGHQL